MRKISLILACCFLVSSAFADEASTRHPFVSGSFYPSDKTELNRMLDGFFEKAKLPQDPSGEILALIVPHAGYIYSGQTAAYAYKLLKEHPVDTVVLIGPYHKSMFQGASIWKSGVWQTPLGDVPVDSELAGKIAGESPTFQFTQEAHSVEHSLEVQLPFLQKTLTNFKIVPILVSDPSAENVRALAGAIHKHLQGKKAIIIASSDMSHYYPDETARTMDARMIELLKKQDVVGIFETDRRREGELCGEAAVLTALLVAKNHGSSTYELLKYSNSSDATGDKARVVGYGAGVLWQGSRGAEPEVVAGGLSIRQKKELLELARQAVEAHVRARALPEIPTDQTAFKENKAVFVTIKNGDRLRGCIGRILAEEPLAEAVRHMALDAATQDPRFSPVRADELDQLHYEVSVLSPPTSIHSADEIVMGRHGVILQKGSQSGVFLPKVAEMFDWDKTMFLGELCSQKARLPDDCWKDPDTRIQVFTAEEFTE